MINYKLRDKNIFPNFICAHWTKHFSSLLFSFCPRRSWQISTVMSGAGGKCGDVRNGRGETWVNELMKFNYVFCKWRNERQKIDKVHQKISSRPERFGLNSRGVVQQTVGRMRKSFTLFDHNRMWLENYFSIPWKMTKCRDSSISYHIERRAIFLLLCSNKFGVECRLIDFAFSMVQLHLKSLWRREVKITRLFSCDFLNEFSLLMFSQTVDYINWIIFNN